MAIAKTTRRTRDYWLAHLEDALKHLDFVSIERLAYPDLWSELDIARHKLQAVKSGLDGLPNHPVLPPICDACGGHGVRLGEDCDACDGEGYLNA